MPDAGNNSSRSKPGHSPAYLLLRLRESAVASVMLSLTQYVRHVRTTSFLIRRSRFGVWLSGFVARRKFWGRRLKYLHDERSRSARLGGRSLIAIVKLSLFPLISAVTVFVLLVGATQAYTQVRATIPSLPNLPVVDREVHASMIGTIAQATAAMLALFFAGISVVASTSYAKLATEVRSLIAYDDLNRRYLRMLAHLTAVCVIALVAQSLGFQPTALAVLYIGVVAVIGILGFFALGARTFALFSPAMLTGYPLRAFAVAVKSVTPAGYNWKDQSFQTHARNVAVQQLEVIDELVDSAVADDHPSMRGTVQDIASSVHRLMRYYAQNKATIPSDSHWFARKAQFARLQLGMGTEAEIALRTGVVPMAPPIPDHQFIEVRGDETLMRCFHHALSRGTVEDIVAQLLDFNDTGTVRAAHFQQTEARDLAASVCKAVVKWLVDTSGDNLLARLQVIDVACVTALSPILNTPQAFCAISVDELLLVSNDILHGDDKKLHQRKLPAQLLPTMEDLLRRMQFERAVEGAAVSQLWYVEQLVAGNLAECVRTMAQTVVGTLDLLFTTPSKTLIAAKRPIEASVWLQRTIEACSKARSQLQALDEAYQKLKTRHHTEAPWYEWDASEAIARVAQVRSETIKLLAQCIPGILNSAADDKLPDLLGHARLWLGAELFSVMESKSSDLEDFRSSFIAYFDATVAVSQHMFNLAEQPRTRNFVRAGLDAMLDLLEISGVALIFSELDGTGFGKIVRDVWDRYFDGAADGNHLLTTWMEPVQQRLVLPVFSAGSAQRFEWERGLVKALADRGILEEQFDYSLSTRRNRQHPSAVIRSLHVHAGSLMDPLSEYFTAMHLAPKAVAEGVPLPRAVTNCIESIEREEKGEENA